MKHAIRLCMCVLSIIIFSQAYTKEQAMIQTNKPYYQKMTSDALKDLVWLKACNQSAQLMEKLATIKLIILDVDGALTNAQIYLSSQGEDGRFFSIQDGYIFQFILQNDIKLAIISGKAHESTIIRAKKLGIDESLIITGVKDKVAYTKELLNKLDLAKENVLMWGDDHLDVQLKQANAVGMLAMPANAPFYFQNAADLVVPRVGGNEHAFRLLADLILYAKKLHPCQDLIEQSLNSCYA